MADITLKFAIAPNRQKTYRFKDKTEKHHGKANSVKPISSNWTKLVQFLSTRHAIEEKERSPYFIFAEFGGDTPKSEYPPPKGEVRRVNVNVKQFYGIVLDVDDTDLEFDEIKDILDNTGLNYVLYTTHSYDPWEAGKEHKFRIVVPYATPVPVKEQPTCIVGFATMIGMEADYDHCSKTASQPMYLHASPNARASEALCVCNTNGTYLDPDEAFSLGDMQASAGAGAYEPPTSFGNEVDSGDRHHQFGRYMAKRRKEGATYEEVLGEIHIWNSKLDNPLDDDQVDGLRRIWDSFERNSNSFGYQHHADLVNNTPMQDRTIYMSVLQGIANSTDQLNASERSELFRGVKSQRPGSTLRDIEADYKELLDEFDDDESGDLAALRLKLFVVVRELFKDYVWLTSANKAYHIPSRTYSAKEGFMSYISYIWGTKLRERFGVLQAMHKTQAKPISFGIMVEEGLIVTVQDLGYDPREEQVYGQSGRMLRNQYVPNTLEPIDGAVKPLHQYFEYLFPEVETREFMKQWLGFLVQRRGEKIKYMPVIYTPLEQVGKDFFMKYILRVVLGFENTGLVSTGYVQENYTEDLTGRQLILMQELDFGRDKRLAQKVGDKLKPYITDDYVQIRRFGIQGGTVAHNASFLAFTNYKDAVFTNGGGERYYLIEGSKVRQKPEWFNKMSKWMSSHEGEILNYFQTIYIDEFPFKKNPGNSTTTEFKQDSVGWPMNVLNEAGDNDELDGLTALPWKWFVKLLSGISSVEDQGKVDGLLAKGASKRIGYVVGDIERFGYTMLKFKDSRGVNFPDPDLGEHLSNRRKQRVVVFPNSTIDEYNYRRECEKSMALLNKIMEGVTTNF